MSKELEVFEIIRQSLTFVNHENEIINDYEEECNIIEKSLQRLEVIDSVNFSEVLACLEYLYSEPIGYMNNDRKIDYNTIKNYILKAQEQEKENADNKRVLEILFKKQVDLGWLWYCIHECVNSLNEYNKKMPIEKFKLTEEEFDLLKRWCEKYDKV